MEITNIKMQISNNIVLSGIPNNLHPDITRPLTLKNQAYTDAVKFNRSTHEHRSLSSFLRIVGRVIRSAEGKEPLVYDYTDSNVELLDYQAKQREKVFA